MAQVDYFLKIDGIKGESRDAKHAGEIEIESFSWGLSNSGTAHVGGGAGAGKAAFQDFSFLTPISSASPRLMVSCATGQHLKQAVLTARKAGGGQTEYYTIKLTEVLVSSYQQSGEGGEAPPIDSFSLNFAKIEVSYLEQDAKGGVVGSPIKGSWDLGANKGS
ncbi:MAG: Hcp family type VI secretion system effector [Actinomycetota bacterium]